jgi:hypothetical protein
VHLLAVNALAEEMDGSDRYLGSGSYRPIEHLTHSVSQRLTRGPNPSLLSIFQTQQRVSHSPALLTKVAVSLQKLGHCRARKSLANRNLSILWKAQIPKPQDLVFRNPSIPQLEHASPAYQPSPALAQKSAVSPSKMIGAPEGISQTPNLTSSSHIRARAACRPSPRSGSQTRRCLPGRWGTAGLGGRSPVPLLQGPRTAAR